MFRLQPPLAMPSRLSTGVPEMRLSRDEFHGPTEVDAGAPAG
jgi:hypothetical protein